MALQVQLSTGGLWVPVTEDTLQAVLTGLGMVLPPASLGMMYLAVNLWTNCGGVGDAAERAQKIAAAQGFHLREA